MYPVLDLFLFRPAGFANARVHIAIPKQDNLWWGTRAKVHSNSMCTFVIETIEDFKEMLFRAAVGAHTVRKDLQVQGVVDNR
jgi:hypothetical protein